MEQVKKAKKELNQIIFGNEKVIDLLFIALLARGHVLLESVPGTGKTKLAKSFAKILDVRYDRIQFTPDVLPSDVTGIRYFNPKINEFELRVGPVMTNILLADEINRATPKTQSSLLEAMEEYQATIDGETLSIEPPFLVIATQNPVESNYGTFPLPEAQLDRFLFKIKLAYPTLQESQKILRTYRSEDPYDRLQSLLSKEKIIRMQEERKKVTISKDVQTYLIQIIELSRKHEDIELGISPRGMLALMKATQAKAYLEGRTYVTPGDIKELVPYLFPHRLILTMEGEMKKNKEDIVEDLLKEIPVPVEDF